MACVQEGVHQKLRILHLHLGEVDHSGVAAFLRNLQLLLMSLTTQVQQIDHRCVAEAEHRYNDLLASLFV